MVTLIILIVLKLYKLSQVFAIDVWGRASSPLTSFKNIFDGASVARYGAVGSSLPTNHSLILVNSFRNNKTWRLGSKQKYMPLSRQGSKRIPPPYVGG